MSKLKRIAEITVALAQIANTVGGTAGAGSGLTIERLNKTAATATSTQTKRRQEDSKLMKIEPTKSGRR